MSPYSWLLLFFFQMPDTERETWLMWAQALRKFHPFPPSSSLHCRTEHFLSDPERAVSVTALIYSIWSQRSLTWRVCVGGRGALVSSSSSSSSFLLLLQGSTQTTTTRLRPRLPVQFFRRVIPADPCPHPAIPAKALCSPTPPCASIRAPPGRIRDSAGRAVRTWAPSDWSSWEKLCLLDFWVSVWPSEANRNSIKWVMYLSTSVEILKTIVPSIQKEVKKIRDLISGGPDQWFHCTKGTVASQLGAEVS